ncbi:MAG: hypothetical protein H6822_24540 [Planctomycetaceae bacterium]|nr:hypothetical protein [Planctomycetales bacterium]MCB9925370.1 hypothetical protein [Planctomycetaceae bacterium]
MPALLPGHKTNFDTLCRAVRHFDAVVVDCQHRETGKPIAVVCAVNTDCEYELIPLAMLFDGDPYELLNPPNAEGGYMSDESP